jgi:hypothetical protein
VSVTEVFMDQQYEDKASIFFGPYLREFTDGRSIDEVLEVTENRVWEKFKLVAEHSPGNYKPHKYGHLVAQIFEAYVLIVCYIYC